MVKESKEVDVIIINYNHENFIEEAIESVLNQSYNNIRKIIIADDGSKDNSQSIISKYAIEHPEIEPILAKENKGIAHNVNRALRRVKAEYVASMAGDDLMLPGKIEKQVEYLNNNLDVVVCSHDMDVFNSIAGRSMGRFSELINRKKINGKLGVEYLFDPGMAQCPSSYMYRKDAIPKQGVDTRLKLLNDVIFDVDVMMNGKLGYIDEILGIYRKHANNVTSSDYSINYGFEEFLIAYSIITSKYPELYIHIKRAKSVIYLEKVVEYLKKGNKDKAKNLSKVLLLEGNYTKGTLAYLFSSIISPDLFNKFYESKYKDKLTRIFYRSI